MVWKPKEKELTREEAIVAAKKELAPFWYGTLPLIAATKVGNTTTVYPLTDNFNQYSWIFFYIDATDFSGRSVLAIAHEFQRRYAHLNLKLICILKPNQAWGDEPNSVHLLIKNHNIDFPVVIDRDTGLACAFRAQDLPKLILYSKGKIVFEKSGPRWFEGAELEIQKFLRGQESGLPLLPLYQPSFSWIQDIGKIDFIKNTSQKIPFQLKGEWIIEEKNITTKDPRAELSFQSPSRQVSFFAQSLLQSREATKLVINVENAPAFDTIAGEDLSYDDEGLSYIRVEEAKLYLGLTNLSPNQRNITLHFPMAHRISIALYGVRFSE